MTNAVPLPPRVRAAIENQTVAEFLAFYGRRGYDHRVGRGTRPAIVVVDFSLAFTRGTANFPSRGYDDEVAQAARLLAAGRGRVPIYYTTIAYEPDMRDAGLWAAKIPWIDGLQAGTPEVEIDARLDPRPEEPVIVKKYPSAFFGTDLDARLKAQSVDTLVICGCTTSVCVRATTIDAMALGYRPLLAAEAIGEMDPALHAIHLTEMNARYADVVGVDELVGYLESVSGAAPPATR